MNNPSPFARPMKCVAVVDECGDELTLRFRSRPIVLASMLAVCTAALGCCSVIEFARFSRLGQLDSLWNGIVLAVLSITFAVMACAVAFAYERVRITPAGFEHSWRVFGRVHWQACPLKDITGIRRRFPDLVIEMPTGPIALSIYYHVEVFELLWILDLIERHLEKVMRGQGLTVPAIGNDERATSSGVEIEVVDRADPGGDPVMGSQIGLTEDVHNIEITRHSAFDGQLFLAALLLCVFWNGILGTFVFALIQRFDWLVFFFMIPHTLVGISIVAACVTMLVVPFRECNWLITSDHVDSRVSFFGIGPTLHRAVGMPSRVERRKSPHGRSLVHRMVGFRGNPFSVAIVDRNGQDSFVVDDLTFDEARWLGRGLYAVVEKPVSREFPHA